MLSSVETLFFVTRQNGNTTLEKIVHGFKNERLKAFASILHTMLENWFCYLAVQRGKVQNARNTISTSVAQI